MVIYVKFTKPLTKYGPVMSRDPGFKFRKFLFSHNSLLNFRKVTKFGRNSLKNKK